MVLYKYYDSNIIQFKEDICYANNTDDCFNEAKDDGVALGSGISWTICKSFAPRSSQITMPAPQHSIFCNPSDAQPTVLKH